MCRTRLSVLPDLGVPDMWISLFIAILTYLLSAKGNSEQRRQALLNSAMAGGATYLATEYTDWGKDVSGKFDSAIGLGGTTPAAGSTATTGTKAPVSLWDTLRTWAPAALTVGGVASLAGAVPSWVFPFAILLGGYLVLK